MQLKVETIGEPSIDALSKEEQQVFYSVLLTQAIEFKKKKEKMSIEENEQ